MAFFKIEDSIYGEVRLVIKCVEVGGLGYAGVLTMSFYTLYQIKHLHQWFDSTPIIRTKFFPDRKI